MCHVQGMVEGQFDVEPRHGFPFAHGAEGATRVLAHTLLLSTFLTLGSALKFRG